ncbi:MAG: ATP-dependent DNA ligase [Candidatus Bathyarchaeota archaeon]|nr:MAG: ATP-dependent DNA ligase [Candidatus Bathyarchaeota archaeon]
MPTLFRTLAELGEKLESTAKRKAMVSLVASFILELEDNEIEPAISMLMGRAFPKWDQRVLEVSWATLSSVIRKMTNMEINAFSQAFSKTGDVGDAIRIIFEKSKLIKQATLLRKPLTITEVQRTFKAIAKTTGPGSRQKKERLIGTLFHSATPYETKYLVKVLIGEMRIGFHEGLMELAVAEAFKIPLDIVQTASMLIGDIGEVATIAKANGKGGLQKLGIIVFRPTKPMLAQRATNFNEIMKEHGGQTALEYKLDGARIQIHKSGSIVKIFSRRLTEVTESFPEIVKLIRNRIKANECVLEGEVIAVGKNGAPMLFQHLMRRFRRIHRIENVSEEIPVKLYLFDVLYIDGQSYMNESYDTRRRKLGRVADSIPLTEQIVVQHVKAGEAFLKKAIEAGHEGLMAKKLDSSYTPGVRGKRWLKIKRILEPLDLAIVAAEYGYGRRHGWLSDYYLAARDKESGELLTVGKTFKGLTDAEFVEMTHRLNKLAKRKEGHKVIVAPEIVVEVVYNEIQESSKYKCGMALRFARISRIRDDKSPMEVDSIQRVREIYERQFEKKARLHRTKR